MFDGITIQMVFLIVAGTAILVVGTTSLRRQIKIKRPGYIKAGKVLHVKHVEKQDKEGYLIQNYYEIRVEYTDNGHRQQKTINSVDEYRQNDIVHILKDPDRGGQMRVYEDDKVPVFGPFILMGAGVLIILLPFIQRQYGDAYISVIIVLLLLLMGISLLAAYAKDKKREVEEVQAEITSILKWQPSGKKKWSSPAPSYYPVLKYTLGGEEKTMRSRYNSSTASSYKIGKKIVLYRDKKTGGVLERGPRKSMLAGGVALLLFAFIGIYSTVVMFLGL